MRTFPWLTVLRVAALAALFASAALFVDYDASTPAFCALDSGCAKVRAASYTVLPVAGGVPLIGLAAFSGLFLLSFTPAGRAGSPVLRSLATLGGAIGVVLIVLQATVIQAICPWCMVVDSCAVVAALAAWLARPGEATWLPNGGWLAIGALVVGSPSVYSRVRPEPPVPAAVLAFYQPGKINVVEFADFQCPYCRRMHPTLSAVAARFPGKVNLVRMQAPREGAHPQARGASLAYLCARDQGKGEAMADALYTQQDLLTPAVRRTAIGLGVDPQKYDDCIADPRTGATVDEHSRILEATGLAAVPTTYIGGKKLLGARDDAVLHDAFVRADRGEGTSGVPAVAFWPLCAAVALGVAGASRRWARAT